MSSSANKRNRARNVKKPSNSEESTIPAQTVQKHKFGELSAVQPIIPMEEDYPEISGGSKDNSQFPPDDDDSSEDEQEPNENASYVEPPSDFDVGSFKIHYDPKSEILTANLNQVPIKMNAKPEEVMSVIKGKGQIYNTLASASNNLHFGINDGSSLKFQLVHSEEQMQKLDDDSPVEFDMLLKKMRKQTPKQSKQRKQMKKAGAFPLTSSFGKTGTYISKNPKDLVVVRVDNKAEPVDPEKEEEEEEGEYVQQENSSNKPVKEVKFAEDEAGAAASASEGSEEPMDKLINQAIQMTNLLVEFKEILDSGDSSIQTKQKWVNTLKKAFYHVVSKNKYFERRHDTDGKITFMTSLKQVLPMYFNEITTFVPS